MIGVNRPDWRRIAIVARGVVGLKAVWLCTVFGAANEAVWLGPAALVIFAAVQLFFSSYRRREALVLACGLAMGVVLETLQQKAGWIAYAPGWPHPVLAPA